MAESALSVTAAARKDQPNQHLVSGTFNLELLVTEHNLQPCLYVCLDFNTAGCSLVWYIIVDCSDL